MIEATINISISVWPRRQGVARNNFGGAADRAIDRVTLQK